MIRMPVMSHVHGLCVLCPLSLVQASAMSSVFGSGICYVPRLWFRHLLCPPSLVQASVLSPGPILGVWHYVQILVLLCPMLCDSGIHCYVPCTVSGVCYIPGTVYCFRCLLCPLYCFRCLLLCPLYSILFHMFIVMPIILCDVKGELVLHFSYFFDDVSMKGLHVICFNTLKLGCLCADIRPTLAVAGLPVCGQVTWTQVTAGYRY